MLQQVKEGARATMGLAVLAGWVFSAVHLVSVGAPVLINLYVHGALLGGDFGALVPSAAEALVSVLPLLCYACAVFAYGKLPNASPQQDLTASSTGAMVSAAISNLLITRHLLVASGGFWGLRPSRVLLGMLLVDTAEFWPHWTLHAVPFLYNTLHAVHHSMGQPIPRHSFHNHAMDIALTTPPILGGFLLCRVSFTEFICVTALSFVATVCDHTSVDKNAFHYLHHCGNKNTNYQQPFFTFYDRLMGTYNPKSSPKLPFYPYPMPSWMWL